LFHYFPVHGAGKGVQSAINLARLMPRREKKAKAPPTPVAALAQNCANAVSLQPFVQRCRV